MPKIYYYQHVSQKKQQDFINSLYNKACLEDQKRIMEIANELQMAIIAKMPQHEKGNGYRRGFSPDSALELLGAIVLYLVRNNYIKE